MSGCDHRGLCRLGERDSNYEKLLTVMRDIVRTKQGKEKDGEFTLRGSLFTK